MKVCMSPRIWATIATSLLSVANFNLRAADSSGANDNSSSSPETKGQLDTRMKWWREARFGMFIHWGVYSVPAGTWEGKQIPGIGEWIMNRAKIPVAEYAKFTEQFNPVKFNADQWVSIAKAAGQKYIVITAKHHDGFAMFHSKATPYNIYDATPFKRDPLAELAEACRKQGIKLGFYYSQAQDWHHPGGAAAKGGHWDKAQDGSMDDYIDKIAVPQVRELLTNYGDVAVLWWDTPVNMNRERAAKLHELLKLQPQIITNNRLYRGDPEFRGDTETPEQKIPATGFKRPRLGNLHDDEQDLGFQELRPRLEEHANAVAQSDRHRQQGRQLPAECRPDLRRRNPAGECRAAQGNRRLAGGQRRGNLRHDRQPVHKAPLRRPLHAEGRANSTCTSSIGRRIAS